MYSKVLSNVMESSRRSSGAVCLIANVNWVGKDRDVYEAIPCVGIFSKNEVKFAVSLFKQMNHFRNHPLDVKGNIGNRDFYCGVF